MLDRLIERSRGYDEKKSDHGPMEVKELGFHTATADLLVPTEMGFVPLQPTGWAFGQVCARLGVACFPGTQKWLPKDYLSRTPPELRASHLNHWIQRLPEGRQWFIRQYGDQARAVLTDRYARIDVTETLKWVKEALDSKGGGDGVKLYGAHVSQDVFHLRMITNTFDVGSDGGGTYAVGAYFTTGEIGQRRLGVYPLVQRTSCLNSLIYSGQGAYEHMHAGRRDILREVFLTHIFAALEGAVEALKRLIRADQVEIEDFASYVSGLSKRHGWAEGVEHRILIGSEGHETLWGVVMGVSAAAKEVENPDERADMQKLAGALLKPKQRDLQQMPSHYDEVWRETT